MKTILTFLYITRLIKLIDSPSDISEDDGINFNEVRLVLARI